MLFKKLFTLVCCTLAIQNFTQKALAISDDQTNTASYIVGAVAGLATGGAVFYYMVERDNDINSDQEGTEINNAESDDADDDHLIRNLVIGTVCGVVVGALAYKLSNTLGTTYLTDKKEYSYKTKLYIKDNIGEKFHTVNVPHEFTHGLQEERLNNFFVWLKNNYKDSYGAKWKEYTFIVIKNASGTEVYNEPYKLDSCI
jgi:hypothetical protein